MQFYPTAFRQVGMQVAAPKFVQEPHAVGC